MTRTPQLGLNLNVKPAGMNPGAWRLPNVDRSAINTLEEFVRVAHVAEAAGIDALFFADKLTFARDGRAVAPVFEPLTLLAALAARTERIGLISTISTTFSDPFTVARQTASLDHLSNGRFGWNVVTTAIPAAAANFGSDSLPAHDLRYERADEFLRVVKALWESWGEDALIVDPASGRFVDADRVRAIDHDGRFFTVAGPLNSPRPPQGWPVIVQAGSSESGRSLAAAHADTIYALADQPDDARAFRLDLRARAEAAGRRADDVRLFVGFRVIVAATRAQAIELDEQLALTGDPELVFGQLALFTTYDLRGAPLDAPLPALPHPDDVEGYRSHLASLRAFVDRNRPATVGELLRQLGGGLGSENRLVGTAADVADVIQDWFESEALDGVNLGPEVLQGGVEAIAELLVPELVRRGLRAPGLGASTLRARYGLPAAGALVP
ncbi:NtaA/DmoA family FMN-dependent monooxygenase [Microbacterium sp. BWT-B31]|uniref:NtaA/DmoA family FMN-dependent monooxygenase n=1 Tax=Microbacterium sp. BWT-B31 TaxID=3232072 RepID=UPI003527D91E